MHAHHGHLPTPLLLALHLAGQTRLIQLGTAIICPNLHHPLDVAEQVAVADLLANGRMAVGFGSGSTPEESALFGAELAEEQERGEVASRRHCGSSARPGVGIGPKGRRTPSPCLPTECSRHRRPTCAAGAGSRSTVSDHARSPESLASTCSSLTCVPPSSTGLSTPPTVRWEGRRADGGQPPCLRRPG